MKKLQEMVQIVTQRRFLSEASLDLNSPENQHFLPYRLYSGVRDGEFRTDEDAARGIYSSPEISDKYRRLKWQTKDILYNKLLLINIDRDNHTEYFAAIVDVQRKLFITKTLFLLGAHRSAEQLARYVLDKAKQYEDHTTALECARLLRHYYQSQGENRLFEEMCDTCRILRDISLIEDEAVELWQGIGVAYVKNNSVSDELQPQHEEAFRKICELRENYRTHIIELSYFRARNVILQIQGRNLDLTRNCDEAIAYVRSNKHLLMDRLQLEFFGTKLLAYLNLRDYANAKFTSQLCIRYSHEGSHNWFRFLSHRVLLSLIVEDYGSAGAALATMRKHENFENLPEHIKERVLLYEGYYALALNETVYGGSEMKEYPLEKLMNETPNLQKDKSGWCSSVVVLQLVYFIKRGQAGLVLDRLESLQAYCHKYLYKNNTYRSQVFIRMLMILAKESLNYRRVERLGRQWLNKLKKHQSLVDEAEVIPFERMWSWVLNTLQSDKVLVSDYKAALLHRKAS